MCSSVAFGFDGSNPSDPRFTSPTPPDAASTRAAFLARRSSFALAAASAAFAARAIAAASAVVSAAVSAAFAAASNSAARRRAATGSSASAAAAAAGVVATSRAATVATPSPSTSTAVGSVVAPARASDKNCAEWSALRTSPTTPDPVSAAVAAALAAAAAATTPGATSRPSAAETSAAYAAASAAAGARNRTRARGSRPPPCTSPGASVRLGSDGALDVNTMGRFVVVTSVASAAMKPLSSPRNTSTSSKRIRVFSPRVGGGASRSSDARFFPRDDDAAGFAPDVFPNIPAIPPPPPPPPPAPAPPASRRDCVASPNRARISIPDRFREGFTSKTSKPSSRAAAYTVAVFPDPTGPVRSMPVAGTPRRSTAGTYLRAASASSSTSSSESSPSSESPSPSRSASLRLGRFLGGRLDDLPDAAAVPAASVAICVCHARSQSWKPRAAARSPTASSVDAGL